jgi:hypothetical protein
MGCKAGEIGSPEKVQSCSVKATLPLTAQLAGSMDDYPPPPCLGWAHWLIYWQGTEKLPRKIELSPEHRVSCAGSFTDREEQFVA